MNLRNLSTLRDLGRLTLVASSLLAASAAHASAGDIANVALSSIGAVAYDNGSFDDYGYDYDAMLAIDGDPNYPSYWAGLDYKHPQRMWVLFDQVYLIDEVRMIERTDAYSNTGDIEYLRNGIWIPLVGIGKSTPHFTHSFDRVAAEGLRVNVQTSTSPSGWYNKVACLLSVEVSGSLPVGTTYCSPAVPNSGGLPGTLLATGSVIAPDNDLLLLADSLPAGQFGYLLASMTPDFVPNPGGSQGNLCLGGQIARFTQQAGSASSAGTLSVAVDLQNIPIGAGTVVLPGETWCFQVWYRDASIQTSNFTDAVTIDFL